MKPLKITSSTMVNGFQLSVPGTLALLLTASTRNNPKYFSLSLGGRTWPITVSPARKPKRLICDWDT